MRPSLARPIRARWFPSPRWRAELLKAEAQLSTEKGIYKPRTELLGNVVSWYPNRSIESSQVMEELVEMANNFREASRRGEVLGLSEDEVKFYEALIENESAARELSDDILKKIAQELTDNLRKNVTVDWAEHESVR